MDEKENKAWIHKAALTVNPSDSFNMGDPFWPYGELGCHSSSWTADSRPLMLSLSPTFFGFLSFLVVSYFGFVLLRVSD